MLNFVGRSLKVNEPKFKVGQKVKVVKGGWGIHPSDIGQVVVIASQPRKCTDACSWEYTVLGKLPNTDGCYNDYKVGEGNRGVCEESFEAIEEIPQENAEADIQFNITRDEDGYIDMTIFGNLSTYQIKVLMDVALGPKEEDKIKIVWR